jgi:hypothetical protein
LWNMLVRCGIMAFLSTWVIKSKKSKNGIKNYFSWKYLCWMFA